MMYITIILQTIALVLIVITILVDRQYQKMQNELNRMYDEIIKNFENEYKVLYQKYKKALDFKYNIRLILLKAESNKEVFAKTIEKIKKELDLSGKPI